MGLYTATSEPGLGLEEDAWKATTGRKFPAQVRVQAQEAARSWTVPKGVKVKSGAMKEQQVEKGTQSDTRG